MMLKAFLPTTEKRYAIAGLAVGIAIPATVFADPASAGTAALLSASFLRDNPLWLATALVPAALAFGFSRIGRRHDRLQRELSAERRAITELRHAASHDALTGLKNRAALSADTADVFRSGVHETRRPALMLLDLDRFKFINDTMGHNAGDEVLMALTRRLRSVAGDDRQVYRLGGDEFVIFWDGAPSRSDVAQFCENVAKSVFRPVPYGAGEIDTAGSIGITLIGPEDTSLSTVLKRADLALYRAKETPGTAHCFFSADMDNDYRLRRSLETALRDGVRTGAFRLEYLPIMNTALQKPAGFATRLRWSHPGHGDVAPEIFLPMTEETGLIVPIGKWMIEQALSDMAHWPDEATVTLPVSRAQLRDPGFAEMVLLAIEKSRIAPKRVILEFRGDVVQSDDRMVATAATMLREAGVRISVAEFAFSIASLSMTRPFAVDGVRIDFAQISALAGEARLNTMLRLILQLAETVGTKVTITGVDSDNDLAQALDAGAVEIQGRFAGPSMPAPQAGLYFAGMAEAASRMREGRARMKATARSR